MLRPLSACALALVVASCAGSNAQLRSDKQRLEQKVTELRAERRDQRREIRDLQNRIALLKDRAEAGRSASADVPELPTEVRRPDAEATAGGRQEFAASGGGATPAGEREPSSPPRESPREQDDDEVIKLTNIGSRGGQAAPDRRTRKRRSQRNSERSRSGAPRAESKLPASTERLPEMGGEVPSVSGRLDKGEPDRRDPRADYRRYLDALKAGNRAFAIAGFQNFVKERPEHNLADNAQYWLAEAHYDRDDFETALAAFREVVAEFPGGNKVADAMLKIGFCHVKLGDEDAARRVLERVIERYADTKPARLAAEKLETLGE